MACLQKRSAAECSPGLGALTMPTDSWRALKRRAEKLGGANYGDLPRLSIAQMLSYDSDRLKPVETPDGRRLYVVDGELHRPFEGMEKLDSDSGSSEDSEDDA